jgi:pimeloyl-ACP methyl ester carboxylesterase
VRSAWLDVDWDAVRHRTVVDGSEIEYVDIGSGPAMVFIHGLGACWQTWLENLPHFSRSHRCVAMDLAGFGASACVDGEVSIERFAKSVAELLDQLGIDRAVVLGNSMGGFIALELAIRRPELVEKLVLVSAAVFWQEYRHAQPLVALARATEGTVGRALVDAEQWLVRRPRLREVALRFGGIWAPASLPQELQAEILLTAKRTEGFLPALRALASYPLREELRLVRCPALVVWGDKDTQVGVRHAFELEREIPNAEVSIYEGIGHVVMLEAPERFNREVAAFISS